MSPRPFALLCLFVLAAFVALGPTAASLRAAEALPRAVIIIDGSGSMWGRIRGREKIVIARKVLADSLGDLKGVVDLGVMSYGHRRRRDCRDIETLLPVGPVDEKIYGKTIRRLLPRGKTPTAHAISQAVQTLGPAVPGRRAHIILVADGAENCRQDPCATAKKIASERPDISIDVVALAISDKDLPLVSCIAANTRGGLYLANSEAQLKTAMGKLIKKLKSAADSQPAALKKQKPAIVPGLYLSAGLAQSGPKLQQGIGWRIYKKGDSSNDGATPLQRDNAAHPLLKLAEGDYHVEARYGPLMAEKNVSVRKGAAVRLHLSFDAAILKGVVRLGEGAPLSDEAILSLYNIAKGPPGPRNIISHKQEREAIFYLSPGKYALKARLGEAAALQKLELTAGEQRRVELLLQAGVVDIRTSLDGKDNSQDQAPQGDGALDEVQYRLYRKQDDDSYREFIRTLDPRPHLVLPAGDYLVHAQKDAAYAVSQLHVQAGASKSLSLALQAGILSLSTPQQKSDSLGKGAIAYTITPTVVRKPHIIRLANHREQRLDPPLPVRSSRSRFVLSAGDYNVSALFGSSNARTSRKLSLKAGETRNAVIDVRAGQVQLSLTLDTGSPPLPGVFWSIFDKDGRQVASASRATPRLTLQQGSYQVVANYLGGSYKRDFIINDRDNKKLELKVKIK